MVRQLPKTYSRGKLQYCGELSTNTPGDRQTQRRLIQRSPRSPLIHPKLDALGLSAAVTHILSAKSGSKSRNLSFHFQWWGEGVFGILTTLQPQVGSVGVVTITLHYIFIYLYTLIPTTKIPVRKLNSTTP